jgi:hypothetical protein
MAAAAVIVVASMTILAIRPDPPPAGRAEGDPAILEPLRLPNANSLIPARGQLTELAQKLRGQAEPQRPSQYTYTRTRTWSVDATAPDPNARIVARDEQRWRRPDLSGRQITTTLDPTSALQPPGTPPSDDTADSVDYPPGTFPVVIESPSADVLVLSGQLAGQEDFSSGPQAALRAVRELYRFHALDAAHRAAALQVLADTDGLHYAGAVDGGDALAIIANSEAGTIRDVAVFDITTGQLRYYETVALRGQPGAAIPAPAVTDFVLFLSSGLSDRIGEPVPGTQQGRPR